MGIEKLLRKAGAVCGAAEVSAVLIVGHHELELGHQRFAALMLPFRTGKTSFAAVGEQPPC